MMGERSFNNCSFKLAIPDVSVHEERVNITFKITTQGKDKVDIALIKVYLTDALGRYYIQDFTDVCMKTSMILKEVNIDIPIEKKNFLKSNSDISMVFLTSDGYKYEILYRSDRGSGISLQNVSKEAENEEENEILKSILKNDKTESKPKKVKADLNYPKNSDKPGKDSDAQPVTTSSSYKIRKVKADLNAEPRKVKESIAENPVNTVLAGENNHVVGTIDDYQKALYREMAFLKNEGGRKHVLTNGVLINTREGYSTYSFELETELSLSDDAPITLLVGDSKANGSVIFCEGFQILIESVANPHLGWGNRQSRGDA